MHEQNAVAGLTNRWLAKIATTVLQAFPSAFEQAEVVGNPVRADLFGELSPQQRLEKRAGKLRLLVVGGSQGARILNFTIPQAMAQLAEKFEIYHQVGAGSVQNVTALYTQHSPNVDVNITEFIDDMAKAYSWADIVVCRAGALTVSELAAVGVPAIFIPFEHKDRQQYLNAKYLADAGGAKIIEQSDFTAEKLTELLLSLDRDKLLVMAVNAKAMSTPQAASQVAQIIIDVAK